MHEIFMPRFIHARNFLYGYGTFCLGAIMLMKNWKKNSLQIICVRYVGLVSSTIHNRLVTT